MIKFFDALEALVRALCAVSLASFIILVFLDVVFREIIELPILWTVDIALALFVWSVFLGAAVGVRKNMHFTVELVAFRSQRAEMILQATAYILVLCFIVLVAFYGLNFALSGYKQYSMMLGYRRIYVYSAIPVSAAIMFVFALGNLADLIANPSRAQSAACNTLPETGE
ncbi:TRAP transporter small permease [Nitratireductor luteus]|uniref:TRAP transporter small permease n=1 Tax=Nitratireductor luteus TaxID=2976980 RepID=UPI00224052F5|nr:TRAP transporter small permease subunit [Nitratireductor luteus]